MSDGLELKMKVAELQEALLSAHPTMPVLLRTIHIQLRADPELTTTLTEEEVGVVVASLSKQTNTEIVTTASKPASVTRKIKSAGASAVDLF